MRLQDNFIKASKGKVLYRLSEPDNYFHGSTLIEGETKADFGEILISDIPEDEKES